MKVVCVLLVCYALGLAAAFDCFNCRSAISSNICAGLPSLATDPACASIGGPSCQTGEQACGNTCVDTSTSTAHCGVCGNVCQPDLTNGNIRCSSGACQSFCDSTSSVCDGICQPNTWFQDNKDNCGSCGTVCQADGPNVLASCQDGTCQLSCATGWGDCGVDITTDGCPVPLNTIQNCNGCGTACTAGGPNTVASCSASGSCELSCATGFTSLCGDLETTGCNCNNNWVASGYTLTCTSSNICGTLIGLFPKPTCPPGLTRRAADGRFVCLPPAPPVCTAPKQLCSNQCVDVSSDTANCGACGNACATNGLPNVVAQCQNGACSLACAAGFDSCGADISTAGCPVALNTAQNCGTCGSSCASGGPNTVASCSVSGSCELSCATGFTSLCGPIETTGCNCKDSWLQAGSTQQFVCASSGLCGTTPATYPINSCAAGLTVRAISGVIMCAPA